MSLTYEDIAVAAGRPSPIYGSIEQQQWDMWIGDALRLVHNRMDRLGLDFGTLNADDVDYVVRESVKSVVLRPDAATQVDVAVEDGRVSRRYQSSTGRVEILPEWWLLLGVTESSGAFSIRPGFEPDWVCW